MKTIDEMRNLLYQYFDSNDGITFEYEGCNIVFLDIGGGLATCYFDLNTKFYISFGWVSTGCEKKIFCHDTKELKTAIEDFLKQVKIAKKQRRIKLIERL